MHTWRRAARAGPPDAARTLVLRGIEVNEQALEINPVYYEALELKVVLLRQRAVHEQDGSLRTKLIAEADVHRAKAEELAKRQRDGLGSIAVPRR